MANKVIGPPLMVLLVSSSFTDWLNLNLWLILYLTLSEEG